MNIEFLIEDYSGREALEALLPRCLEPGTGYQVHHFGGKQDLLKKLSQRLKGYRDWITEDYLIVVLIDRDAENCLTLKQKLEEIAIQAGFKTKSQDPHSYQVLNRIIIEELEAWFFGDVAAITLAYPKISSTLDQKSKYRDPDAIAGGTWEALERILQKAGYHPGGLDKLQAAREIATHMNPVNNRSKSFQVFYESLKAWQSSKQNLFSTE
jgi:hypothetical protein